MRLTETLEAIERYYAANGRHDLPWRVPGADGNFDPYKIMVSELMLQQTQVGRVIPKYQEFLTRFPSLQALAAAQLGDVLVVWQGLGYNRRAKFLWQTARQLAEQGGVFPAAVNELVKLPGVGVNTAGAIMAYSYDAPVVFVETNIRTVMIYHFFAEQDGVADNEIRTATQELLAETDLSPREFYWALMDYGTHLKQTVGNLNKLSREYSKQSKFEGSRRQVRGAVLRALSRESQTLSMLTSHITDERLPDVLADLQQEGLVHRAGARYSIHSNHEEDRVS